MNLPVAPNITPAMRASLDEGTRRMRARLERERLLRETVMPDQPCRACGTVFPYDADADYCPECAALNCGDSR